MQLPEDVDIFNPTAEDIVPIMDKIKQLDKVLQEYDDRED
jgi:hypothetical protein